MKLFFGFFRAVLASALTLSVAAFEPDVVVDDADSNNVEFSPSSAWVAETVTANAFRGSGKVTASTTADATHYARFHTTLPTTGLWRVFVWRNGRTSGTPNAATTRITHAATAPTNVRFDGGGSTGEWVLAGVFRFDSTKEAEVKILHNDSGLLAVDAVRFSYCEPEIIVDANSDNSAIYYYPSDNAWSLVAEKSAYQGYVRRNNGFGNFVHFSPALPAAGAYDISIWIPAASGAWLPSGGTMLPSFEVYVETGDNGTAGADFTFEIPVPTTGANEGRWVRVGTKPFRLTENNPYVSLRVFGAGYVAADAVRFTRVSEGVPLLMDNDSIGVQVNPTPGNWSDVATASDQVVRPWGGEKWIGLGPTARKAAANSNNSLEYTPGTSLPASDWYDVYLWYPYTNSNATNTVVKVIDGNSVTHSSVVDQTQNTARWVPMGRYNLSPSTAKVTIQTAQTGSNNTMADAVMFSRVKVMNVHPAITAQPSTGFPDWLAMTDGIPLSATVSDDGLPNGTLVITWEKLSGPGAAIFGDANAAATDAHVTQSGLYTFSAKVTDGEFTQKSVTGTIKVNQAPQNVDAGPDQALSGPGMITLSGAGTDDGFPNGSPGLPVAPQKNYKWQKQSGPGLVTFGNDQAASTTATFVQVGTYVLQLTVDDGMLSTSDTMTVRINAPPIVNAGPDKVSLTGVPVALEATATDDGLPLDGQFGRQWTLVNGPGAVQFENAAQAATNVVATISGSYTLRLTATDGQHTATDDVVVLFNAAPANVNAGLDRALAEPGTISLTGTATDDGYPTSNGGVLNYAWQQVSGPAAAIFAHEHSATTGVQFPQPGSYVVQLTVGDTLFSTSDTLTVQVNAPPVVSAGPDKTTTLGVAAALEGSATDADLPENSHLTLAWTKISGDGVVQFENAAQGMTNVQASVAGAYVLQLSASDGKITKTANVTVTFVAGNAAPTNVNAGPDQVIAAPGSVATLSGSATDDGLPAPATLRYTWRKISGAGTVTFSAEHQATTSATFSQPGAYVINFIADDTERATSDTITVTIERPNVAPVVSATVAAASVPYDVPAALTGTASDDGLPKDAPLSFLWSKVSGPGTVTFANAGATVTTATFSEPGQYVVQFEANDTALTSTATVTVTVEPPVNQAPVVNAGPDQTPANASASADLLGVATDDGLPAASTLNVTWSKVSGPGQVSFVNGSLAQTSATFTAPGIYTLRLTASDGTLSAHDEMRVAVNGVNEAPIVSAGADQTIAFTHVASVNLLINGSGETALAAANDGEWINVSGERRFLQAGQVPSGITPIDGSFCFVRTLQNPASDPEADCYQEVSVASYLSAIQQERVMFAFSGHIASSVNCRAKIAVDFLDGARNLLKRCETAGESELAWQRVMFSHLASPETRYIRVHLMGINRAGYTVWFDGLKLTAETLPAVQLNGTITDDGKPVQPGATTAHWKQVSGPGTASFDNHTSASTFATLPLAGTYVFQLTGDDTELSTSSTVTITANAVTGQNAPPSVTIPPEITVEYPANVSLTGVVQDDGLPSSGQLTYSWGKISGPGQAFFAPGNTLSTNASFSMPGTYVVRLTASDGEVTGYADVVVNTSDSSVRRPLDIAIAVDRSGSMSSVQGVNTFLHGFISYLDEGLDRAAFFYYGTGVSEIQPLTYSKDLLNGAADRYAATGNPNQFSLGIAAARIHLQNAVQPAGRPTPVKVLLIISDGGADATYEPQAEAALARAAGIRVVTISYASDVAAINVLRSIVSSSADYIDGLGTEAVSTFFSKVRYRVSRAGLNQPPLVLPGGAQMIALGQSVNLGATVLDDGLPDGGSLGIQWKAISGPDAVTFSVPQSSGTQASFASAGTYVLEVTAFDGQYSTSGTVVVDVLPADLVNTAPTVAAGPDFEVSATQTDYTLSGTAIDDGLPSAPGSMSVTWGLSSGPGEALFGNPNSPTTTVRFTAPGEYVLVLRASDGERVGRDFVTAYVAHDSRPAPSGLVAWWPSNGDTLDVRGGVRAQLMNYAGYLPGKYGQAFGVNGGTSEYYTIPSAAQFGFENTAGYTFEFWLRRTEASQDEILRFGSESTPRIKFIAGTSRYFLQQRDASGNFYSYETAGGADTSGTWIHIAVTYDAATKVSRIYAGGALLALPNGYQPTLPPENFVPATSGLGITLLKNTSPSTNGIDEFSIYNRPLTLAEIQQLANYRKNSIGFNQPPVATLPAPVSVRINEPLVLAGKVVDDAFAGHPLSFGWSKVSGPGSVVFGAPSSEQCAVTFSAPGSYTLRFSTSDTQFTSTADATVQVLAALPPNQAPQVAIVDPPVVIRRPGAAVALNATITDDGQPGSLPVTYLWEKISGPGSVSFTSNGFPPSATATFSAAGQYQLRLSATDGLLTGLDTVDVLITPLSNQPPTIAAGGPYTATIGEALVIHPTVTDDDQPTGGLAVTWSGRSGPAPVQLDFVGDANGVLSAVFSRAGTYVLRLTAEDGEFTVFKNVTVTVTGGPSMQPPMVQLLQPANGETWGVAQSVNLLAGVTPQTGATIESVEFIVDDEVWAELTSIPYSTDWRPASTGAHTLKVRATDSRGLVATTAPISVNIVVPPPTVALVAPVDGAARLLGSPLQLAALASSPAGMARVDFYANGTLIATDSTMPFTGSWTSTLAGSHSIVARAVASDGQFSDSPAAVVSIETPVPPGQELNVLILTPADGGTITERTCVTGNVKAGALRDWTLEARSLSSECKTWRTLKSGTNEVTEGNLGIFDPTLELNGPQEIRLTGRTRFGEVMTDTILVTVEGNMKIGHFTMSFQDMTIPLAGIPINIVRTYDSRDKCKGDFGPGWRLDVDTIQLIQTEPMGEGWFLQAEGGDLNQPSYYYFVDEAQHLLSVRMPDGELLRFQPKLVFDRPYHALASLLDADGDDVGQVWAPPAYQQALKFKYRPLSGTKGATLAPRDYIASPGGAVGSQIPPLYIAEPFGGVIGLTTAPNEAQDAPILMDSKGWILTTKNGRKFVFNEAGKLEEESDSLGNKVVFARDGHGRVVSVVHTPLMGPSKSVVIHRYVNGLVEKITDFNGKEIGYSYDSFGRLDEFRDRANPSGVKPTARFGYEPNSNRLEEIFDARGFRVTRNDYDENGRLVRSVDAYDKAVEYSHDLDGKKETIVNREGEKTVHSYDELGNVTSTKILNPQTNETLVETQTEYHQWSDGKKSDLKKKETIIGKFTDENGNLVQKSLSNFYYYEDDNAQTPIANDGLLRKIVDPMAHESYFTYDSQGNVLTVKGALDRVTAYTYYPGTSLVHVVEDAEHHTTTFTYDARGKKDTETRTATVIDAHGNQSVQTLVTDYDFDALGYLIRVKDPAGHIIDYVNDDQGNRLTETTTRTGSTGQILTQISTYEYDVENRLLRMWDPEHPKAPGVPPASETVYDGNGRPFQEIDALGRVTEYTYNNRGELIATVFAKGTSDQVIVQAEYDFEGRRTASVNRRGKRTENYYDDLGRMVETWFIGSEGDTPVRLRATTYDGAGRVFTSTDANCHTTKNLYNDSGRRWKTVDHGGNATLFYYDDIGNLQYVTDAEGRTTEYVYDRLNRRISTIFPPAALDLNADGIIGSDEQAVVTSILTNYDEVGRRVKDTDANGRARRFVYDKMGRLTDVVDALGQITSFSYDEVGNRLTQKDARGKTTEYSYDNLSRLISRKLPEGQIETISYDSASNLKTHTDFNGTAVVYQYDNLNRLKNRTSNHPQAPASNVSFTYTLGGLRETMADASGVTTYSYDSRDRLKVKQAPQGVLTYTYDNVGNVSSVASNHSNGVNLTYVYDELNRLDQVQDNGGEITQYGYDNVGNLKTVAAPNGVTHTYSYNSLNRLETLSVTNSTAALAFYSYTQGLAGHRTAAYEDLINTNAGAISRMVKYNYDVLYRLRRETLSLHGSLAGQIDYDLDPVGNRLARTTSLSGTAAQTFTYDDNDRIDTAIDGADLYDNNGNTTTGKITLNAQGAEGSARTVIDTYDSDNRLIARSGSSGNVTVVYNGDGHKVRETINGQVTEYLVDELNPTGYAQVVEELQGGDVMRVYTYGHDLIAQDQRLGPSSWLATWYGYDGHGSVRMLTNGSGQATDRYDYDAFGVLLHSEGATSNRYRYAGEQFDDALGLYFLRARYMNPANGRFWSMDSYEGQAQDPGSLHKYTYCSGDPANQVDPSGMFSITDLQSAMGSIGIMARMAIPSISRAYARVWVTSAFVANSRNGMLVAEGIVNGLSVIISGGTVSEALAVAFVGYVLSGGNVRLRAQKNKIEADPELEAFARRVRDLSGEDEKIHEGFGLARYEVATGKPVSRPPADPHGDQGVDGVVKEGLQSINISLKGPLVNKEGLVLIPSAWTGLIAAVKKDLMGNSGSTRLVIDLMGRTEAEVEQMKLAVASAVNSFNKQVVFLINSRK